jgi:hypothetical protein
MILFEIAQAKRCGRSRGSQAKLRSDYVQTCASALADVISPLHLNPPERELEC